MHDSGATGELLGHKTMAMAGWYVEKATAPLRAGERRAMAKLHRNMPMAARSAWCGFEGLFVTPTVTPRAKRGPVGVEG